LTTINYKVFTGFVAVLLKNYTSLTGKGLARLKAKNKSAYRHEMRFPSHFDRRMTDVQRFVLA